ncbi:MAG TPA: hypothetical protein VFV38_50800, partial [Ktedonobacteraceae bacterium]|nr:hypothetical protein [Ktedonobacteraceae bacterium]
MLLICQVRYCLDKYYPLERSSKACWIWAYLFADLIPLSRTPYFTGREEILEVLHKQLGIEQAVALTQSSALHG